MSPAADPDVGDERPSAGLRRDVSTGALIAYGVGGMLGGGIYALVAPVAGKAGELAWLSFLVAMIVAAPTAISYVGLATRFPRSGGEAHYVRRIFRRPRMAVVVGWLVALSGLVSLATLSVAFAGYTRELIPAAPREAVIVAFLIGLSAINLRGISFTSGVNILCTVVEVSGLVIVIVAGAAALWGDAGPTAAGAATASWSGGTWDVLQGGLLAFYAFIGFEDMVNIAEEVKRPRRAYRLAIPIALTAVSATYITVTVLATRTVPIDILAGSSAPLAEVVDRGITWLPDSLFDIIALFAVANSALLGCVMASRLLYGMSDEGLLPGWLAAVNRRFGTPHRTIAVVLAIGLGLALTGTLSFLAGTTGLILLAVFATMNVALFVLLGRDDDDDRGLPVPRAVPAVGALLAAAMMTTAEWESVAVGGAALAIGGLLALIYRPDR